MGRAIFLVVVCLLTHPASAADPAPAPKVTAVKLVETFMTNEALADESYSGKEVEITGKVARIYRPDHGDNPPEDKYVLEFEVGDAGKGVRYDLYLLVFFDEKCRAELAKLKPGQTIRVRGECSQRGIWQLEPRNPAKHHSEVVVRKTQLVLDRVE